MVSERDNTEKSERPNAGEANPPRQPTQQRRRFRLSPSSASWRGSGIGIGALGVALVVAALTLPRLAGLQSEATRRLGALDERVAALQSLLERTQDELRDARNRTAVLESRAQDTAGLQAQIEKLYRNLAEDSTDVLLAEVESSLVLGGQQLALGGSTQAALAALQELEARIVRENNPGLQPVQRALLRDIDHLKSYPSADIGSLALRIDALSRTITRLPLVSSVRQTRPPADASVADRPAGAAGRGTRSAPSSSSASNRAVDAAQAGLGALREELAQFFRVRRIDTPEAMLVAPDQAFFLRENLRLLLLNVRVSLLSRNDALFHADLERAVDWMRKYYDVDDRAVANAIAQLRQLSSARLVLEPPTLAESLAAVRAARGARDASR